MDSKLIDAFPKKTVLVLGDVMLDKYIWGDVSRISPEAPVPIVHAQRESFVPGGAANVANNIVSLGGNVVLVGIAGNDGNKDILLKELQQRNIAAKLAPDHRPTITKVRIMGQKQQLLRVDYEQTHLLEPDQEQRVLELIRQQPADAVIISDYAKGTITQRVFDAVKAVTKERGIPLVVDVKPQHRVQYQGATVIKMNHKEACEIARVEVQNGDSIEGIGKSLVGRAQSHVVVTRGDKGVSIFSREGTVSHVPTKAKQVFDVTGAGDTFLAAFTLAFTAGANLHDAAEIANHAAGLKVGKVGTATVSAQELKEDIGHD